MAPTSRPQVGLKHINNSGDVINSLPKINFWRFPPDKNWLLRLTLSVLTEKFDRIFFEWSLIFLSLKRPFSKKLEVLKLFSAQFS